MPDAPRTPPRRPRGRTRRYTEAQLDKLADVTPDDVEAARDAWNRLGGNDGFGNLLDAETEES